MKPEPARTAHLGEFSTFALAYELRSRKGVVSEVSHCADMEVLIIKGAMDDMPVPTPALDKEEP
jgi:hypothetical protein